MGRHALLSASSSHRWLACPPSAMFVFYGANRTGRFCLTGDHEVLTDNGWQRLDEWTGGKIACWNPSGETVSFQKSNALVFPSLHMRRFSVLTHRLRCCLAGYCKRAVDVSFSVS